MKNKRHRKEMTPIHSLLLGVIISAICLVITVFICGIILYTRENGVALSNVVSTAALLLSGLLSGFIICRAKGDGAIFYTLLSTLLLSLILLLIGLLMSHGALSVRCPINFLCYIGVATLVSFICRKKDKRHK